MSKQELIREDPIFEEIEFEELTEAEDKDGTKLLTIKGTASRGNMFNKNNRMYPTEVLNKVVEKLQPVIKRGSFLGQLDHPGGGFFGPGRGDLEAAAIKFTNMWMEGDDMKFTGNVIPTNAGKNLEALLRSKVGIGMSTRGYGTQLPHKKKDGKEDTTKLVVQDDFELMGVDAVLTPANHFGKIAKYEHKEGGNNVELTMELFKKDYSELYDEVKAEVTEAVKADLEKDFEARVETAIAEKTDEIKEAAKAEVMDSDEVKNLKQTVSDIVESLKPLIPGQAEYEDAKKQEEIDSLKEQLSVMQTDREAVKAELDGLKAKEAAAEEKAKVVEHINAKVDGQRFAEQLKKRLEKCQTIEQVDESFDAEVEYINSLLEDAEEPTGSGKVKLESQNDATKKQLDEEKKRQQALAGIVTKQEGGK
jgi:hypothetical protein